ncbi:toll-like receptor 6 isoform X2 [Littorina saxatilis]|uniref:toll-like receptor 6 isoform X2 n=1 Tax=Littorina saxatilis TaxID=31220 RepID=UPI0038B4524D
MLDLVNVNNCIQAIYVLSCCTASVSETIKFHNRHQHCHTRYERYGYDPSDDNQQTSPLPNTEDSLLSIDQATNDTNSHNESWDAGDSVDQQDLSLVFLFGNVSHRLQLWSRTDWIHLDLSANDLTYLPDTLFNQPCAEYISSLFLFHNRLSSLTSRTFKLLTGLRHLDLSHNALSFLPRGSLPSSLFCLDLPFNDLREVREDVFHDLTLLDKLDLSHNAISDVQPRAFHTEMQNLGWVSLAYNKLTALESWPYVLGKYVDNNYKVKSVSANLSHNMISHFINNIDVNLTKEITGPGVDLTYNNLTTLNQTELSSFVDGKRLSALDLYLRFKLNVKFNPLVCDCHMYWVVEATDNSLLTLNSEAQTYFNCAAPIYLQGRPLGYLLQHPHLLVCDVIDDCPEGCECLETPHLRYMAITCPPSRHNYTHIPRTLPGRGALSLNLSRQALSSLEAGSGDVSRLQVLDVSNNRVEQVLNSFLDAASNLQVLDLRNNLLMSLPAQLQRLSVSNLRLGGNPLQCTCDLVWFGNYVKVVANNATSPEQPSVDVLRLYCMLSDGRKVHVCDTSKWELDCDSSVTLQAVIGGGVALVVVVAAMAMCWRWRYHVRVLANYISSLQCFPCCAGKPEAVKRDVYDMPRGEVLEEYDVYISLDEDDEKISVWASTWLLPLLENRGRNPPRVYLPLRQELLGVCKAESRVERICQSNKVLVILSPSYVNNGWCRHEFDHACRHLQNHNPKSLVIVVLDNDPDVRKYINDDKIHFTEDDTQRRISKRLNSQKRESAVCGVNVQGCNCDAARQSSTDVVVNVAENGEVGAEYTVIQLTGTERENTRGDGGTDVEQIILNGIRNGQNRDQNIDADHVGVHGIRNGKEAEKKENKLDKRNSKRRGIGKNGSRNNNSVKLRQSKIEQLATEDLERKQLRQRQFLEELSHYTEDGQQVALEPLRSFLLEGRYVSASDLLFKYKLLFEISRIRKEVDFIDCD